MHTTLQRTWVTVLHQTMCTGLEGEVSVGISAHEWYRKDKKAPTGDVKADTQQSAMTEAWGELALLDKRKISQAF